MHRLEDIEAEAVKLIEKHFKLRLHGDQRAFSQWDVPYVAWANGYMTKEGEITPDTTKLPQELLSSFDAWLAANRTKFDVIVMRSAPLCERWTDNKVLGEDGTALKTRLLMRCHFMKKEVVMMDEIMLKLPSHAVRMIARLCREKRDELSSHLYKSQYTLQADATYDSLDTIESVIPQDIWDQVKEERRG